MTLRTRLRVHDCDGERVDSGMHDDDEERGNFDSEYGPSSHCCDVQSA
jgi:hypothetical protein